MLVGLDLLTDWQDLDTPLRVQTAKGTLTLTQLATLTLRGQAFSGAINPHMQLSLISEGMLFVEKNWKFINESGQKLCIPPGEDQGFHADMVGNLAFWPQQDIVEAMGASNKVAYNINQKLFHSGDTTETEEDEDLPEANPSPRAQLPATSQEEPEPCLLYTSDAADE